MADDIVTRLRCSYADPPCEACTFCAARAEIERLREERDTARVEASIKGYRLDDALDEIERLRSALAIAAGMISTLPPYENQHPEAVMEMLIEEARRG